MRLALLAVAMSRGNEKAGVGVAVLADIAALVFRNRSDSVSGFSGVVRIRRMNGREQSLHSCIHHGFCGVGALIQRGGRAVAGMLTIATAGGS